MPNDLLAASGATHADLRAATESPALRRVFSVLLHHCAELNRAAAGLPREVRDTRLRLECSVIVSLARRLTTRLRRYDPLAMRVKLSKTDALFSVVGALRWIR